MQKGTTGKSKNSDVAFLEIKIGKAVKPESQYLAIVEFAARESKGQGHNGSYSDFSCKQRFREVKPEKLNCFKKKPADKE